MHHKFFIFNFHITVHVGSMLIFFVVVLDTKKLSIHLLLTYLNREAVTKSCSGKKMFLLSRFNLCETSVKGSYASIIAGFFLTTFAKINAVTGIFQGFYLDFKQFSIVCSISRSLSNGRFRKF